MTTLEQVLTLSAPYRFMAMVNIGSAGEATRIQVQAHEMVNAVDKTAVELLEDIWKRVPIQQLPEFALPLSFGINHLRNEVARQTRRAVANVVILQRAELFEQCEIHDSPAKVIKIVDSSLQANEIRTVLAAPAGMFVAFDAGLAFTPSGNFVNEKTICGSAGYFARGFINE